METVGQRIKALRRITKTSQKELGKFCGVSDVAVGYWEKDVNVPSGESLAKLAKYFNTSIDYILYGTEFEGNLITKMRRIPVISWVQAGQFTECKAAEVFSEVDKWVETSLRIGDSSFALEVKGDSMTNPNGFPTIPEGATVIVDPDAAPIHGKIVVARLDGTNEATVKKLVIDGPQKFLVPLNPRYPNISINGNCLIIGVVKGVQYEL
ncbi:LexA family transcriptional regulator [Salmonella enterica]|uniref:LexA family transcriptional regulator n=1 Tax=Salmonella enterica subsp. enterica serovar Carrau TaxID=1160739 RepID=A0A752RYD4_SALET|nr:LexA family transcriptional regulator [Salmonella enterica]EBP9657590.1 LexA family transcriptional regulator [Salmonella enterica subsp. enterica]EHW1829263.1 LexA family transcriptional regulator [Salmonella enterica subsp. arizonae serovar 40:z36:-]HAF7725494.1 LexA family transcriptional regulator [Salmonella enterica subsp. enterica serovar Carrau]EBJ8402135.1 LexA family transcriptional regulator [Salmonella enterica]EBL0901166.1 LexA family transcriptional regulator [Salmonella enter